MLVVCLVLSLPHYRHDATLNPAVIDRTSSVLDAAFSTHADTKQVDDAYHYMNQDTIPVLASDKQTALLDAEPGQPRASAEAAGALGALDVSGALGTEPNATATWATIGNKIRAGQHLPVLPLSPPPPPLIASADAILGHSGTYTDDGADAHIKRLSSELAEARALIHSLRAQVQALQDPTA